MSEQQDYGIEEKILYAKGCRKENVNRKRTNIRYKRDDYRTADIVTYNNKETNICIKEWRNEIMTNIVMKELERNVKQLECFVDKIVYYTSTTEEIMKLNFESIRMLVDYCEELSLEGEIAMERWLISPRLAKIEENNKNEEA